MSLFSVIIFHQLFSIYGECSIKFEKNTEEYEDCMRTLQLNEKIFEEFLEKNQTLLKEYIEMLENFKNQEFLYQMHLIQKKIDEEIDNYISKEEQLNFISEYFSFKQLINESEFIR
ncbi:hypothetical protein B0F89_1508 [Malaciobacter marinus]|jgi:hypothetical protein|uniref:Uncharacterized protein n=1 Tax=Malaciobacter marinus TaxID=505249 RepID=A0AB36ZVJ5_9BACT|nr:hypothetical protein [Malaciobacter marinus]PPK57334.1 hypothetical protein B0F89_1508 [Malaciobacter marinus]